jgi:LPXTG-motif cell wall-anchored protein
VLVIAVFGGLLFGTGTAGAQTLTCSFNLSTNQLPAGGGSVQVSGTAPADTTVRVFVNGTLATTAKSSNTTGAWGPVTLAITATSTVSVSADNYPATPCAGVGTITVATATAALPRTGSDTSQYVLAGISLVVVGIVLTVAARRRDTARGRA